jgi:hypothetical protein
MSQVVVIETINRRCLHVKEARYMDVTSLQSSGSNRLPRTPTGILPFAGRYDARSPQSVPN